MVQKKTKNNKHSTKNAYYIVEDEKGEKFLLPYFAETFRVLMDDKDTIRDLLNRVLGLDRNHEIVDLTYEFEKSIDIFMPEDNCARLDVWVTTKDHRYSFGFAISAFSSREKFSRILGLSIAKTMLKTVPRKSGHNRFSPKIGIL